VKFFIILVILSVISLIPQVRTGVSDAIADARESLFNSLQQKTIISGPSDRYQQVYGTETQPNGSRNSSAMISSRTASQELHARHYATQQQLKY